MRSGIISQFAEFAIEFNLHALYAGLRVLPSLTPYMAKSTLVPADATW